MNWLPGQWPLSSATTARTATANSVKKHLSRHFLASKAALRFPNPDDKPHQRVEKPEAGRYHLVRLIRSDLKLNILGELFTVPPELKLEYVVATIDVKEQKLKLYLEKAQVDEFDYKIR